MENTYEIGVGNRYDLFLNEEEDPLDILRQREEEKEKKKEKGKDPQSKGTETNGTNTTTPTAITSKKPASKDTTTRNIEPSPTNGDPRSGRTKSLRDTASSNERGERFGLPEDQKDIVERKNRRRVEYRAPISSEFRDLVNDSEMPHSSGDHRRGSGRGKFNGKSGSDQRENSFDIHISSPGGFETEKNQTCKRKGSDSHNWRSYKDDFQEDSFNTQMSLSFGFRNMERSKVGERSSNSVLHNSSLGSEDKPITSNKISLGNSNATNAHDVVTECPEISKFDTFSIDVLDTKNLQNQTKGDDDIPDIQICEKLCKDFASLTNTDEVCAHFYLQDRKWNLGRSVRNFVEDRCSKAKKLKDTDENEVVLVFDDRQESIAAAATAVLRNSSLGSQDNPTTPNGKSLGNARSNAEFPEVFKFITWNIQGLDPDNLQIRTKAVTNYVKEIKADVIFFQEVVPKSEEFLRSNLKNYKFLFGGDSNYYTGLAYNPITVQYQSHFVADFSNSTMGRNLLVFKANIGSRQVLFLNTHLESCRNNTTERKNQLRLAFQIMTDCPSNLNVIFAGDINLRDRELTELGGIPNGVSDAWIACGERKEWAYTWDMEYNDNIIIPGNLKPRLRFDRIYYKSADKAPINATIFELIGLSRLTPFLIFPSDHWGLLCSFSLDGKTFKW